MNLQAKQNSVEKSGTGVAQSGIRQMMFIMFIMLASAPLIAQGTSPIMVAFHKQSIMISMQSGEGMVSGSVSEFSGQDGYYQAILFAPQEQWSQSGALSFIVSDEDVNNPEECDDFGIMSQGSGSGALGVGDCVPDHPNAWGIAEVSIDEGAVTVLIHKIVNDGLELVSSESFSLN